MKPFNTLLLQYIDVTVKSWEGRTFIDIFNVNGWVEVSNAFFLRLLTDAKEDLL